MSAIGAARWIWIAACVSMLVACGSSGTNSVPTPVGVVPNPECIDVTGLDAATETGLSAGPFNAESLAPNSTFEYKIWAASNWPGTVGRLTILAYPPTSGAAEKYVRSASTPPQTDMAFFPGLVKITQRGVWRFVLRYEGRSACFVVKFPDS